ncbi:NnrU family protein [Rubellimicrobium aerolatum]|uniref:NnrU family protein n=1 Tax=Rubellimicrobium aerolatum TaxID=490979 RepID=A0ABW0SGK0_9RHOB|nr:NnrU family protein [Rubellimicrobium aerolatum]MBP1807399.1 putative membrane protein [Rubellimicrobium aerolatum]
MTGWTGFTLAMGAFLLTHFVPTRPSVRSRLLAAFGRRAWFSIYGFISLAVTAWVIVAAGQAPYLELWPQVPWTRWVPNLLVPLAVLLAALGLPAPTVTLGGPRQPRASARPDLSALTRHPLLWSLALWSGAHLAPNGDLAHVILFGLFLALALGAMPLFDARARAALGPRAPVYFAAHPLLSLAPLLDGAWWRGTGLRLLPRAALALALWLALLWLHPWVIGVSPLPL